MKEGTEFVAVKCPYCKGDFIKNPEAPEKDRYCEWCWNGIVLKEKPETERNKGMYYRIGAMFGHKEGTHGRQ